MFNDLLTNYERVADHCSNIAVALIELESDSFDTHEYLNSLKELKSDMYERYYEEYRPDLSIIIQTAGESLPFFRGRECPIC